MPLPEDEGPITTRHPIHLEALEGAGWSPDQTSQVSLGLCCSATERVWSRWAGISDSHQLDSKDRMKDFFPPPSSGSKKDWH